MRLERWERWTDWPLTVGAVGFLVAYAWPILQPGLDGSVTAILSALTVTIWVAFALDYVVRVSLAERRLGYGDRVPVTVEGRLIAVGLMLAGIGLLALSRPPWRVCSSSASKTWRWPRHERKPRCVTS